jgi:hypothetical protein
MAALVSEKVFRERERAERLGLLGETGNLRGKQFIGRRRGDWRVGNAFATSAEGFEAVGNRFAAVAKTFPRSPKTGGSPN